MGGYFRGGAARSRACVLASVGCTSISRPVVIQAADLREQMRREVAEHEAAHRRSAQLLAEAQVHSIPLYIAPAVYYTSRLQYTPNSIQLYIATHYTTSTTPLCRRGSSPCASASSKWPRRTRAS